MPPHVPKTRIHRSQATERVSHQPVVPHRPPNSYLGVPEQDSIDKSVGEQDVQEGAITGAHIRAQSITTEHLEVGVAITMTDEFGTTVLTPSGFSGAWFDFVRLGVYNGGFSNGEVGSLPLGRTVSLPYWTLSQAAGSPSAEMATANEYVNVYFSALSDIMRFQSDFVPVLSGVYYNVPLTLSCVRSAGIVEAEATVLWYDHAFAYISSSLATTAAFAVTTGATTGQGTPVLAPGAAHYAILWIDAFQSITHDVNNRLRIHSVGLWASPPENLATHDLVVNTLHVLDPIGILADYVETTDLQATDATIMNDLNVEGDAFVGGEIRAGAPTVTEGVSLSPTGSIEIAKDASTPFLDFKNDAADDFDARLILLSDDLLEVQGAALGLRRLQHANAGVISPTALAANTNDWNPTGLSTAWLIRATTDATPRTLSGISAQGDGTIIYLHNANASTTLTLAHDATSTGANRFLCPGAANYSLTAKATVMLAYDSTADRWLVLG